MASAFAKLFETLIQLGSRNKLWSLLLSAHP